LYCAACDSSHLEQSPANTEAVDFLCPRCSSGYQLKAQSRPFAARILDAAYGSMRRAILEGRAPHVLALHYEPEGWMVRDLLLIPRFAFTLSILEKRKPLAATARRARWIGCNFLLARIPPDVKIWLVSDGVAIKPAGVRRKYARIEPLNNLQVDRRGWTLDVLNALRLLHKREFTLAEVYDFEKHLQQLHPQNRHVRDKIRQQLQVLRDLGLLDFLRAGHYRLRGA